MIALENCWQHEEVPRCMHDLTSRTYQTLDYSHKTKKNHIIV